MSNLIINTRRFALPAGEYYQERFRKDLIVLHFTAGNSAAGAFSWWSQDRGANKVATAYIVDLDGTVYQTFDPECWAFHMGTSSAALDRRTIGIEIVNFGPLRPDRTDTTRLNSWPRNWTNQFCRFDQRDRYVRARWRGEDYWASYPQAQMDAVRKLVESTTQRFSIPSQLPPSEKLLEFDPTFFASFRGVAAHHNFRADKTDVGPAFNWAALGL
jgi:N-acetyl-anhydromuramyl-L-alanine amidase AmpD